VRCFGTFTDQLRALVAWLRVCRIDTVAMEATSVLNYKYLFITLSREGGASAMDFFEDDFAFCLPNVAFGLKIAVRQIAFD